MDSDLAVSNVPSWLFSYIIEQLADAMGPMADFVLRERIAAMGETLESFPRQRIIQLVEETSNEILDDTLKANFKRNILNEIQSMHAVHASRSGQAHPSS